MLQLFITMVETDLYGGSEMDVHAGYDKYKAKN